MKLFHTSDVHLGARRLDGRLPDGDFEAALEHIVDTAIDEKADAFLLAGDLFDKPQVEPPHLLQAQRVLGRLRAAGIPVIAIEGNHDRASIQSDAATWLSYLAQQDLLILLRTPFTPEGPVLGLWDPATKTGAYIDLGGVRFTGAGYLGSSTDHKLSQIVDRLEAGRVNVVLLHAGPKYFVGEGGGFSRDQLRSFHDKITYLALGHMHKPILYESWACNPGSPENVDLTQASYDRDKAGNRVERGYAVVEIDPAQPHEPVALAVRSNRRRRVVEVDFDCTGYDAKRKTPYELLIQNAVKAVCMATPDGKTVVHLHLKGKLNLEKIALDLTKASREIAAQTGAFVVAIDPSKLNLGLIGTGLPGEELAGLNREELERNAVLGLLENDGLWGLDEHAVAPTAELFYDLKEGVRLGATADQMAELILNHPLTAQIQAAQSAPPPVPSPGAAEPEPEAGEETEPLA